MSKSRLVTCPHCKTEHEIASDIEAQVIPCPQCGKHMRIRPLPALMSQKDDDIGEAERKGIQRKMPKFPSAKPSTSRHSIDIHIKSIDVPFWDILMFTLKNFAAALLIGMIASLAFFLFMAGFSLLKDLFSFLIEIIV